MILQIEEASRITFQWKCSGTGALELLVDNVRLPVLSAAEDWKQVEFEVQEGSVVKWKLSGSSSTREDAPAEGWMDALVVTGVSSKSLNDAVGSGSGLEFDSVIHPPESIPWKVVGYRDEEGIWMEGARGIGGGRSLRTWVTGPAIVSFNAICTPVIAPPSANRIPRASETITVIGPNVKGRYLGVTVGDREMLRLSSGDSAGWQHHKVYVPEGTHALEWKLGAVIELGSGTSLPEWQTWVADVIVRTPRADYDSWAADVLGEDESREPHEDADGDGQSNFFEYAYGSDPGQASSRSPEVYGEIYSTSFPSPLQQFRLRVPRVPAHVPAVLMTSPDLQHWTAAGIPLRSYVRPPSVFDAILVC